MTAQELYKELKKLPKVERERRTIRIYNKPREKFTSEIVFGENRFTDNFYLRITKEESN